MNGEIELRERFEKLWSEETKHLPPLKLQNIFNAAKEVAYEMYKLGYKEGFVDADNGESDLYYSLK